MDSSLHCKVPITFILTTSCIDLFPHYFISDWKMLIFLIGCLPWNTRHPKKQDKCLILFLLVQIFSLRHWCLVISIGDHCFVGGCLLHRRYCFPFPCFLSIIMNSCFLVYFQGFQNTAVIILSDVLGQGRDSIFLIEGYTRTPSGDWVLECPSFVRVMRSHFLMVQNH